ncbi:MAG: hypothetical protein L3J67_12995 [Hyphomicrobiaceae bacterium]|nr:hypothetical protein [Hyphomicrobiaceae bacterium]
MPNTVTRYKRYPLPHPDNPSARADVARIRTSIEAIDRDIGGVSGSIGRVRRDIKNLSYTGTITLRVGNVKGKFPSIQHAVNHAKTINRPAGRWINIIVDPGEYRVSSITVDSLDCIQILSSDEAHPEKTRLVFTPDKRGYSHGILFYNCRRARFSGFKLIGHGIKSYRAIYLTAKSEVWSRRGSIIIENFRNGIEAYHDSAYWCHAINMSKIADSGVHCSRSHIDVRDCRISGIAQNKGWGLLEARYGGYIYAYKAQLSNNRCGAYASEIGSYVDCGMANIKTVEYGIYVSGGGRVSCAGNSKAQPRISDVKHYGVCAYSNGHANVPWLIVDKARRGFYADTMSFIHASYSSARNISEWSYISYSNSLIEAWHTKKRLSKVKYEHTPKASGKPGNYDSVIRFH